MTFTNLSRNQMCRVREAYTGGVQNRNPGTPSPPGRIWLTGGEEPVAVALGAGGGHDIDREVAG